jgi:hypothetical protein
MPFQDAVKLCTKLKLLKEVEKDGKACITLTERGLNVTLCMTRILKGMGVTIKPEKQVVSDDDDEGAIH